MEEKKLKTKDRGRKKNRSNLREPGGFRGE